MPKRVDQEERRRQIADALLRTAAARGLHATGMREVAAEAGVSLRLVQYYFGTKEELLLSGMQQLAARFAERAMTRIRQVKETGGQAGPRDVVAAILAEALPADAERRTFAVLNAAYFALALTDPALATGPLVKNTDAVVGVVAAQLRAAQAAGGTPARLDPDAEALGLLAMAAGLGNSVLAGQSSAERAQAVIDYHLDRLFAASRPALHASRGLASGPETIEETGDLIRAAGGAGDARVVDHEDPGQVAALVAAIEDERGRLPQCWFLLRPGESQRRADRARAGRRTGEPAGDGGRRDPGLAALGEDAGELRRYRGHLA